MDKEPVWIAENDALAIHRRQLSEHGGLDGIRDATLLASAMARPQQLYAYAMARPQQLYAYGENVDLPALAASYAYGIARNHPFVDGNKRTALVAARLFLRVNGHNLVASREDKYRMFLSLAEGSLPEAQLAEWIRIHTVPEKSDA